MTLAAPLFFAGICVLLGGTLYSEMLDRGTTDDPLGDAAHGDWVTLPEDFEPRFHDERKYP